IRVPPSARTRGNCLFASARWKKLERLLVEEWLVLTDSHEEDFPHAPGRLRLEVLDAVRRRTPVTARRVGDLIRISLLVEFLLKRRIRDEGEAFDAGWKLAVAVRHHDA